KRYGIQGFAPTTIDYNCSKRLIYLARNPIVPLQRISDEFEQGAVRITEVDGFPKALGAEAGLRSAVDSDAATLPMLARASLGPCHSKQRSLPPGGTGIRATGLASSPGP